MTDDKNKKGAIAEALDALEGLLAECKDEYRKCGDLAIFDRNYAEEIQAHANLQAFVDEAKKEMYSDLFNGTCDTVAGCLEYNVKHDVSPAIARRKYAKMLHEALRGIE